MKPINIIIPGATIFCECVSPNSTCKLIWFSEMFDIFIVYTPSFSKSKYATENLVLNYLFFNYIQIFI